VRFEGASHNVTRFVLSLPIVIPADQLCTSPHIGNKEITKYPESQVPNDQLPAAQIPNDQLPKYPMNDQAPMTNAQSSCRY
jgi:hypothetical protein